MINTVLRSWLVSPKRTPEHVWTQCKDRAGTNSESKSKIWYSNPDSHMEDTLSIPVTTETRSSTWHNCTWHVPAKETRRVPAAECGGLASCLHLPVERGKVVHGRGVLMVGAWWALGMGWWPGWPFSALHWHCVLFPEMTSNNYISWCLDIRMGKGCCRCMKSVRVPTTFTTQGRHSWNISRSCLSNKQPKFFWHARSCQGHQTSFEQRTHQLFVALFHLITQGWNLDLPGELLIASALSTLVLFTKCTGLHCQIDTFILHTTGSSHHQWNTIPRLMWHYPKFICLIKSINLLFGKELKGTERRKPGNTRGMSSHQNINVLKGPFRPPLSRVAFSTTNMHKEIYISQAQAWWVCFMCMAWDNDT